MHPFFNDLRIIFSANLQMVKNKRINKHTTVTKKLK
uniref:Uncharacterized protein n=1 Tax=Rhizophora mucronata TaxID=61149 RepID=A0A2P2LCL1_RHIMU